MVYYGPSGHCSLGTSRFCPINIPSRRAVVPIDSRHSTHVHSHMATYRECPQMLRNCQCEKQQYTDYTWFQGPNRNLHHQILQNLLKSDLILIIRYIDKNMLNTKTKSVFLRRFYNSKWLEMNLNWRKLHLLHSASPELAVEFHGSCTFYSSEKRWQTRVKCLVSACVCVCLPYLSSANGDNCIVFLQLSFPWRSSAPSWPHLSSVKVPWWIREI